MTHLDSTVTQAVPTQNQPKRSRRGAAKSRHGCSRCKQRRVKCDELRPDCGNCIKSGARCPGASQQFRWSVKHERFKTTPVEETESNQISNQDKNANGDEISMLWNSSDLVNPELDLSCPRIESFGLPWLSETPPLWPPGSRQDVGSGRDYGFDYGVDMSSPGQFLAWSHCGNESLKRNPSHLPTILIDYWFQIVCPLRSTFDSEVNYNRQIAFGTWSSSEPVFRTLQAMSAACLAEELPQIQAQLPSLSWEAMATIRSETGRMTSTQTPTVTLDLVFATFALGTSVHWMTTEVGQHTWLESARGLLALWETNVFPMYAMLHAHFCQALTYWEMCVMTAGHGSILSQIDQRRALYQECFRQNMKDRSHMGYSKVPLPHPPIGPTPWSTRPNSWCGVSEEVIHYFGQVLALCRRARPCARLPLMPLTSMTGEAFCDLLVAQELQKDLLALDFTRLVNFEEAQGFSVETQDVRTPVSHLTETAEAYRLAGLLQLEMAFDSLTLLSSNDHTVKYYDIAQSSIDSTSREHSLLKKALNILTILERIPVESGSSSIHPILYLAAAVALKHGFYSTLRGPSAPLRPFLGQARAHKPTSSGFDTAVVQARTFVLSRLNSLQKILPHRASKRMLEFVKDLWWRYDYDQACSGKVHEVDAMIANSMGLLLR